MTECRICFEEAREEEEEDDGGQLIAPCLCNGTSRYVHRQCLERWRGTGVRAFTHCFECNFKYIIEYAYPLENYTFSPTFFFALDFGRYLFGLLLLLLEAFFLRYIDKLMKYPSLGYLESWGYGTRFDLDIIEDDEIYSSSYYFSLTVLFSSIIVFLCLACNISYYIKRKKTYWGIFIFKYLFFFILSIHFLWFHFFFGNTLLSFELFILTDSSCAVFNIFILNKFLEEHNKLVGILNTQYNPSRLLEPSMEDVI